MNNKIKVGIVGYGNLGKGVELALAQNEDFELEAIFTRRDPSKLNANSKMVHISNIEDYKGKIDVMILCGGSALDLPKQGPKIVEHFNTVDSFDTHARIPKYFKNVDEVAKKSGTIGLISIGWDPGLFSLNRILSEAVLPNGKDYTFWGTGVSQGHSDAIRRVEGVKNGVQYTVPVKNAIERVRSGENPELAVSEKHNRVCYVVPEEGADTKKIEEEIKNMPNYFADYDTEVHFVTEDVLKSQHSGMPHGGFVIRTGNTSDGNNQRIEFSLKLSSNPQFTASVIVAYARAVYRLSKEGKKGAHTIFDIPLSYISPKSPEELRAELL
ncbi:MULTISPECIES: diaminopimelate dehydrogenase [Clostridium]|uniref:diaminopimelate dehydrogenase n=1 Tax=Clostridium TaxID=1485 RepID=UPI0004D6CB05|nr:MULTISPECIES: diaminopimelate dehydrogenase [Clostridium]KEH89709.1 cytochrome C2 [Clostridium novyi A str. 4540]KEH90846.1 cytochrome C2 [Clostridium novyi A str. BKT29909]KEH92640.1 cytochrome C2 [Clostridium novyi A str. GD211209]KEH93849.1 cytochrome C2 [Clostridium botulinum C/D str. It1]